MNISSRKEFNSAELNITGPITTTPQKYRIVSRAAQVNLVDKAKGQSQRKFSEKHDIPRTTLQHWISRKEELKERIDSKVVDFFESPSGQAWLHQMVVSVFIVFHQNGNSGIPDLHEFFEMTLISKFVGTSVAALQKTGKTIDENIIAFGREESERLSQNMLDKNITGALDENFIMDEMTLILMDPVSGFILAEELEEKRDSDTWNKVTQAALQGLKVTVSQLIGDEAGGLTKLATSNLHVMKGSDLFHIQQEITKGLTAPLARVVQQVKKKQEDLEKEKIEMLQKVKEHLKLAGGIDDLSKRGVNACKRMLEIEKEEKANQKEIEISESR